jgi:putative membrane protein
LQQVSRNIDFSQPKRQNAIAVILLFANNLRRWAAGLIPLFFVFGQGGSKGIFFAFILIGLGILALLGFIGFSIAQWQRFVFYVEGDHFVLEKGVLVKTKLDIPIERIQSIHLKRNIFHRVFNITSLQVDSAGSKGSELEINALDRPFAHALRDFLYQAKAEIKAEKEEQDSEAKPLASAEAFVAKRAEAQSHAEEEEKPILSLSPWEVLIVGLTENHLRTGFFALALVFGYANQLMQYMEEQLDRYIQEGTEQLAQLGLTVILFGTVAFLVLSVLISVIRTFLNFFNFKATHTREVLQIKTGLLSIKEYQVPKPKIQYLEKSSNPLRKLVNIYTMVIFQATSEQNQSAKVEIPGCKESALETLYEEYMPETLGQPYTHFSPDAFYRFRLMMFRTVIPSLLLLGAAVFTEPWVYAVLALYLPASIVINLKYYGSVQLELFDEGLRLKKGWIFPTVVDLPLYKVQNVELKQSIFQERRDLKSLQIHLASGSVTMPFLPQQLAHSLANLLLYKVERSNRKWM